MISSARMENTRQNICRIGSVGISCMPRENSLFLSKLKPFILLGSLYFWLPILFQVLAMTFMFLYLCMISGFGIIIKKDHSSDYDYPELLFIWIRICKDQYMNQNCNN